MRQISLLFFLISLCFGCTIFLSFLLSQESSTNLHLWNDSHLGVIVPFQKSSFYVSLGGNLANSTVNYTRSNVVQQSNQNNINGDSQQNHLQSPAATPASAKSPPIVAYAISLTSFEDNADGDKYIDAARVLKQSVHMNSIQGNAKSKYNYQMYAFVHPNAKSAIPALQAEGYITQVRTVPVNLEKALSRNNDTEAYRAMKQGGCCGATEFLKLYVYQLTQHPIAVHVDLDVLILQPLDEIFDPMIQSQQPSQVHHYAIRHAQWNKTIDHPIEAYFTRDYTMISRPRNPMHVGMQGGFLVVKPSADVFQQSVSIIENGEFHSRGGYCWGDHYGAFYGAAQIQGFIIYLYGHYRPHTFVELNRCHYNSMNDPHIFNNPSPANGTCMTGQPLNDCQSCRDTSPTEVYTAHFTLCGKPWQQARSNKFPLCEHFFQKWHETRLQYELDHGMQTPQNTSSTAIFFDHWIRGKGYQTIRSMPNIRMPSIIKS